MQYHLASIIHNCHDKDVRSLCAMHDGSFYTGSRDFQIRLFVPNENASEYTLSRILIGHENDVSYILQLSPSEILPLGGIASAGYDNVIRIWPHETSDVPQQSDTSILTLIGHEQQVCCLAAAPDGRLLSGSWDTTIRIWNHGENIQTLKGHDFAVWSILVLPNGDIVSASGDMKIKIWRDGEVHSVLSVHTAVVRYLLDIPGVGFLSCSNDSTIILWSYSGEQLRTYTGHAGYIYAMSLIDDEHFVSCSDDATVRVWSLAGECIQVLSHPRTVWSVTTLANGDIVAGGMDKSVFIWSRDDSRRASSTVVQELELEITRAETEKAKIGDLNMKNVAGPEALLSPGNTPGQLLMVREGNKVRAYNWDANERKWELLGDVTDAKSNMINGVEYDHVVNVTMDDGVSRKLGHNNGENPFVSAMRFLNQNELPQDYLDEIAKWIVDNIEQHASQTLTMGGTGLGARADPFTGGSAYRAGEGNIIPLTDVQPIPPPEYTTFPQTGVVLFQTTSFDRLRSKLLEAIPLISDPMQALSSEETALVSKVLYKLEQKNYSRSKISSNELDLVRKLLTWPMEHRTTVYDVLRNVYLFEAAGLNREFMSATIEHVIREFPICEVPVCKMLLTWSLANAFRWRSSHSILISHRDEVLNVIANAYDATDDRCSLGLVTCLLNLTILVTLSELDKSRVISILSSTISTETKNSETLYRAIVLVGTLVWNDSQCVASAVDDWDMIPTLNQIADNSTQQEKVIKAARELIKYLEKNAPAS